MGNAVCNRRNTMCEDVVHQLYGICSLKGDCSNIIINEAKINCESGMDADWAAT